MSYRKYKELARKLFAGEITTKELGKEVAEIQGRQLTLNIRGGEKHDVRKTLPRASQVFEKDGAP